MELQRTQDWFAARIGLCTSSKFADAMAKLKSGKPSQARTSYALQLVCERISGQPTPHFETAAMRWGTEHEPAARVEYAWRNKIEVQEVGFIRHPTLEAGASPDGFVTLGGIDGCVEIKSPTTQRHLETWLNGMPEDHIPQIQGQMWITGRQFVDFVSFDPRLNGYELYVERIERDDGYIANLEEEIREFLAEVESIHNLLREKAK